MRICEVTQNIVKAGCIPYYFNKGQLFMMFCLSSDPAYGGDKFMIGKGHVDAGENIRQAALREAEEELGLKLSNIDESTIQIGWQGNITGMTETAPLTVYICQVKDVSDFNKPGYEIAETKWFTPKQFAAEGRSSQRLIVKQIVDTIKKHHKNVNENKQEFSINDDIKTIKHGYGMITRISSENGKHIIYMRQNRTNKILKINPNDIIDDRPSDGIGWDPTSNKVTSANGTIPLNTIPPKWDSI